jgi:hypothetical protein
LGFIPVIFRDGHTTIRVGAADTYFDEVIICCLIMAANLTGKVFPTNSGCLPYRRDVISLNELYEVIAAVSGDVTQHFKQIEKTLQDGKMSMTKMLTYVIKPLLDPILKQKAARQSSEVDEE